jgi:molecular chaperone DnaK (HSP70)
VGEFHVEQLDDSADEGSPVLLNMNLDLDGILTATAIEQHTGLSKSVVLDGVLAASDEKNLAASRSKIRKLFGEQETAAAEEAEYPDVAGEDSALQELLIRAERSSKDLEAEDLQDLNEAINDLKEALNSGDQEAESAARQMIEDILFFIERK